MCSINLLYYINFILGIQEKLGISKNGEVHALFDYKAENPDELSFSTGDVMTVLRKGDDSEKDWWWCRMGDKEGYAPRNLLGVMPPISFLKLKTIKIVYEHFTLQIFQVSSLYRTRLVC